MYGPYYQALPKSAYASVLRRGTLLPIHRIGSKGVPMAAASASAGAAITEAQDSLAQRDPHGAVVLKFYVDEKPLQTGRPGLDVAWTHDVEMIAPEVIKTFKGRQVPFWERNPAGRRGMSSGTLPAHGKRMLESIYDSVYQRALSEMVPSQRKTKAGKKKAASIAARQAWCQVGRHYYKKGGQWHRRKHAINRDVYAPRCGPASNPEMVPGSILKGGLADAMDLCGVDVTELGKGIRVEMEHTDDPAIAMEIALDHLAEDPIYYTMLEIVERHR